MAQPTDREYVHRFVWADLATPDDIRAADFYRQLFGWSDVCHVIAGGTFRTLEHDGRALASLYRLARTQVGRGVAAHWIPYVSTPDVAATAAKATELFGRIVVQPQHFPGLARVCLIADPTGAILGLWQGEGSQHEAGGW
jgi:predicted enzyme related to lactoylglutathione lyase